MVLRYAINSTSTINMEEPSTHTAASNGAPKPDAPDHTDWSQLDVRSAEVQEIIGRPPHWLVRWGITAFMGVLILVLVSAWAITYPEVIDAPLRLTAIHAPKTLESKVNGKLRRLLVDNNTRVREGQVLAWLESTAGHRQVLRLAAKTDSMHRWLLGDQFQQITDVQLAGFWGLGELQTHFQTFEQAHREFVSFQDGGFYSQRRQMLEQELRYTKLLLEKLKEQQRIQQEDYELARREYTINKRLADDEIISPMDFLQEESRLLSRRLPLEQTESAIISNHASQTAKQKELMELDRQRAQQKSVFLQALNLLKSAIEEWKANYLLISPLDGKVIYTGILQENQTLSAGQEVFYIQPDNTDFFGELAISQSSFGKIEVGQEVLVRFNSYPDQEFGSVTGRLDYVSDVPVRDSVFIGKVTFPDGLETNYGRELTPRNGMTGQAEIITQDMRLLERFYNNITKQIR